MVLNDEFITKLTKRISEPLPGKEAQLRMAPTFRPDLLSDPSSTKAAVLLLLYNINGSICIIFTKRQEYKGIHSGQISFPGGKYEASDKSIFHTALRETEEEIGVNANTIQLLGRLSSLYIPVSRTDVTPIIGYTSERPDFLIDPYEVEYLIEANLEQLLDPSIKEIKPYKNSLSNDIPYFNINGNHVWGATAMILNEFLEILKDMKF
jgi:8-oxo-dGTP pyrophosphatase MutT (NUDIX family)